MAQNNCNLSIGQQLLQLGVVLPQPKTIIAAGMVFKKVYTIQYCKSSTASMPMPNGSTARLGRVCVQ